MENCIFFPLVAWGESPLAFRLGISMLESSPWCKTEMGMNVTADGKGIQLKENMQE